MARKLTTTLYWFDSWTAQRRVHSDKQPERIIANQLFARIIPENGAYTVATNDWATTGITAPTYGEARNIIEGLFTLALGD